MSSEPEDCARQPDAEDLVRVADELVADCEALRECAGVLIGGMYEDEGRCSASRLEELRGLQARVEDGSAALRKQCVGDLPAGVNRRLTMAIARCRIALEEVANGCSEASRQAAAAMEHVRGQLADLQRGSRLLSSYRGTARLPEARSAVGPGAAEPLAGEDRETEPAARGSSGGASFVG